MNSLAHTSWECKYHIVLSLQFKVQKTSNIWKDESGREK